MREVVGDAGGVVHVAVSEQDVVDGDNLVGGLSDVEADVELGDGDDGFLTGDGVADDVEVVDFYMCQIMAWHRVSSLKQKIVDGCGVCVNLFLTKSDSMCIYVCRLKAISG